jgi:hypothetical protein
MESMNLMDEFFMNYKEGKPPNVSGVFTTDKFDFEYMKKYLIGKVEQTRRSKTKIICLFGKHYIQHLSQRQWEIQREKQFIKAENIHTKEDLERFSAAQLKIDMHEVPYRYILIPDYSETRSKIMFICNHALYDGSTVMPTMVALTVDQDFSKLGRTNPASYWKQLLHILVSPISIVELGLEVLMQPIQNNCLKKPIDAYKNREARVSDDYQL